MSTASETNRRSRPRAIQISRLGTGAHVTIKRDEPIGATEGQGFLHRGERGQDMVMGDAGCAAIANM